MEEVVIIGGSPAVYMCGIYNHTANISPVIVKTDSQSNLDFRGSDMVSGVDAGSPEEFVRLMEEQAKNMGIRVVEAGSVGIEQTDSGFRVRVCNKTYETKSLVIDDKHVEEEYRRVLDSKGVFYTSDRTSHREAVVMAGAGCKTAFDVKEFIERDK